MKNKVLHSSYATCDNSCGTVSTILENKTLNEKRQIKSSNHSFYTRCVHFATILIVLLCYTKVLVHLSFSTIRKTEGICT